IALHTLGQGSSGALEFLFYHRDAKYRFKGRKKVNDGIWHQVAVTKSGNLVQIYVDGQPDSTTASISRRSGFGFTPLVLGQFLDTGFPSGAMDNFRLYKRTLSPSEVLAVFESEKPPPAIR
ncbi:MAG: LamG domain-containing protein, partial [Opitutae bacterium]